MTDLFNIDIPVDNTIERSLSITKIRKIEKLLQKKLESLRITTHFSISIDQDVSITQCLDEYNQTQHQQYKNLVDVFELRFSIRNKVAQFNANHIDTGTCINNLLTSKEYYSSLLKVFKPYSEEPVFKDVEVLYNQYARAKKSESLYSNEISVNGLSASVLQQVQECIKNCERQLQVIEDKITSLNNSKKLVLTPADLQLCENNGIIVPLS